MYYRYKIILYQYKSIPKKLPNYGVVIDIPKYYYIIIYCSYPSLTWPDHYFCTKVLQEYII